MRLHLLFSLVEFETELKKKEHELLSMSNRRSANNLEMQRDTLKQQIQSLNVSCMCVCFLRVL